MELSKRKYRDLCNYETSIPLFSKDWWLDACCGEDGWSVSTVERDDKIIASLPYCIQGKENNLTLTSPKLTKFLGPWLMKSEAKYAKRISKEKNLMTKLIAGLQDFKHYRQNWHHSITNWLPFYWKGFSQTTKYTYLLKNLNNHDLLWENTLEKVKTEIRKAKSRKNLRISFDLSVDEFLEINNMSFAKQNVCQPYSDEYFRRLDKACSIHKCKQIISAIDENGVCHSTIYIVWDDQTAYYLCGGNNSEYRGSEHLAFAYGKL